MSVIDTIKSRPLLFGSVAVGGIVLIIALRASSGGTMQQGTPLYGDVGFGDQALAMQQQTSRDIALAGIQAQSVADTNAAALEATRIDAAYKTDALKTNQTISLANINATLQALTTRDTLTAQTEQAQIAADKEKTAIAANANVESQRLLANALTTQAQYQAQTTQSYIQAQVATAPKQSLWSRLFG